MVQIKAEQLKWCQAGFIFHLHDTDTRIEQFRCMGEKYVLCQVSAFDFDEPVWVDEEAYKNSVIAKIEEIFVVSGDYVISIAKDESGIWVYSRFHESMFINIDPMPWEEEYTITLGEE